ncbi:amino acid ABC transporter permease [Oxynema sp. CENA135]|uniref:amino acid ABC transporter permease n=1 Tax=Oxynema sp. CENA135 TaxID=984206 RepID=UPI00190B63DE|nr:amino acid ABC transporter permease [Oxynema sp. CENA135]MBK4730516.1 amino acid ABC transporter permease [Oxynema sp. CENA135]
MSESLKPETTKVSPWTWMRQNLFNSWYNSIITLICCWFLYQVGRGFIHWAIALADWQVVRSNFSLFFVGRYPQTLYWRMGVILGLVGATGGLSLWIAKWRPRRSKWIPFAWILLFPVILWLIGGGWGLQPVRTDLWNGLLLTLLTATVSIVLSFPMGVLLALGRQSSLPIVRWGSVVYIEIIRGFPLIGILFMAQVMLPLFLPANVDLDRVVRAIAGLTIFSAAYMAENVRGGLQSVPRGQVEAAKALGLSSPLIVVLIILPQALRAVIPAIVGQFIGLFKDTSLLSIVGLVELTGMARSIVAQPEFIGRYAEVYIFVALIYWLFCYGMSWASRRLEKKLGIETSTDNR